jgi:class 3 adenylate cyclase
VSNDPDLIRARIFELARSIGLVDEHNLDAIADLAARASTMTEFMDEHALVGLLQAYGRAVDRIASAEAQVAARHLAELRDAPFEAALEAWLADVLPLAVDTFGLIHARRLEQLVRRRTSADAVAAAGSDGTADLEVADLAVAMIDLRGSTAFMIEHPADAICTLVDDLYFAVGEVAARHEVHAGKFLGDGVLFFSADGGRLLDATLDAVAALGRQTALRAGAGIARGPVIRHAGDWFGTPVNLASRLGELAGPDEVLVDEDALPADRQAQDWRSARPRGLADDRRLAVLRPARPD